MLVDLLTRVIALAFDFVRQPSVEEATEQLQQTSLDDQDPKPSPDMPQNPPNDRSDAPGDSSRTDGNRANGRYEGHPRDAPRATAHRNRVGEQRTNRADQFYSRPRTQTARFRSLENDYHQLVHETELLERSHRGLSATHEVVLIKLREAQTAFNKQQQETNTLREKLRSTSALLDVRNQELKVAKTFLSKEDPFSTSDVVQSVRDLNSEIMQTTAHLAENLHLKRIRTPLVEQVPEGPYKSMFVTLVLSQGSGEEVDVGSLELVLQGFLTSYVCKIANAWCFSKASSWYEKLYSKVCETEDHTVASNWRVLTRRTLSNMDSSKRDLPSQIVNGMIKQLAELLSSCGVGESVGNAGSIQKCAVDKLRSLSDAARKLNKMIGENVVSEDLVATVIPGGETFDGAHMEDAYPRGGVKPGERAVICTTDLGLCVRKGAKGVKMTLLKPKVALRSL